MNENIFREYDIRGRVPEELNAGSAGLLGRAMGTYFREHGAERIAVGRDCRLSSPELCEHLAGGLASTGLEVLDLGMVPTPLLYHALFRLEVDGGVEVTGSHNPPRDNGFKLCLGKRTLFGSEIRRIGGIAESGRFAEGTGRVEAGDIVQPYLNYMKENLRPGPVRRRVVLDCGNGVAGVAAPEVFRAMGVEVDAIFCEPDGRFPHHHPDPTVPDNLRQLAAAVRRGKADLGIGFDGDADRIGAVDDRGEVIPVDRLMILFSRDLLKRVPGAGIIADVKSSQVLFDDIERHGGVPVMWKAGHSLIKDKMQREGALLAGELSGHLFFAERYFGYDDGIYAGARLLEILTNTGSRLRDLLSDVPRPAATPEIRMECADDRKFAVVETLTRQFKEEGRSVIDVDGARVLLDGGWGLVRASNTQPALVMRFEARDEERLDEIRERFTKRVREAVGEASCA
jgi:phosphomannomutase / phosphoglucomutase